MQKFIAFVNGQPFEYYAGNISIATILASKDFPGNVSIEILPASVVAQNNAIFWHELILLCITMVLVIFAMAVS